MIEDLGTTWWSANSAGIGKITKVMRGPQQAYLVIEWADGEISLEHPTHAALYSTMEAAQAAAELAAFNEQKAEETGDVETE